MSALSLDQLVPVLQLAIGPAVLVSGCGLLLLSLTNRLGRATDLARSMARHLRTTPAHEEEPLRMQLRMLLRRTMILRRAIALTAMSALLAAILILQLFVAALLEVELAWATVIIFVGCVSCLIAALVEYIADVNAVLAALKIEAGDEWPGKKTARPARVAEHAGAGAE
jgi:hypothetical protein